MLGSQIFLHHFISQDIAILIFVCDQKRIFLIIRLFRQLMENITPHINQRV